MVIAVITVLLIPNGQALFQQDPYWLPHLTSVCVLVITEMSMKCLSVRQALMFISLMVSVIIIYFLASENSLLV